MSLERARWVLVDDTAEDVSYSGQWFIDTYARPGPSQYVGSATGCTAHGTTTASGFAFSFEGVALAVRGQSNIIPASTNSVLGCTIDGVEGETDVVSAENLNFWTLCSGTGLSEGRHQVVVNIAPGPNTIFWLDEIIYYSLSNPNIRRQWSMLYPNTDEFKYTGVNWVNPFDEGGIHGRETYQNGAKAIIPFYGTSVELASYLTSSMPRVAGSGTYSLDGGPPVRFEMPIWTSGFRGQASNDSIFRHTVFITPPITPGHHTLEVINLGNPNTVPLAVHYFLIHHGDVNATTGAAIPPGPNINTNTNPTVGAFPTNPSNPSGSPSSTGVQGNNIGVIVGVAVGMLVLLAAVAFIFFWVGKRRGTATLAPQWIASDYVALHPRGIPMDPNPNGAVLEPSASDVVCLPDYAASDHDSDATSQHQMRMYYRSMPKHAVVWSP